MKNIITLLYFIANMQTAFTQTDTSDAMLQKIAIEKDNDKKVDLLIDFISNTAETNPLLDLKNAQKLLVQSQKNNDLIGEAIATGQIGYDFRALGYIEKSLKYGLESVEIANKTGNEKLKPLLFTYLGNDYKDLGNYPKAISLYSGTWEIAAKLNYFKAQTWAYENLSEAYLAMNNLDLALMYAQKDYELSMLIHYYDFIGFALLNLGIIHGKIGNHALSQSYFDMAINNGLDIKSPKILNWAYTSKAEYFDATKQKDSSIIYAKKAIEVVNNTAFARYSLKPSKLLLDIYRNTNIDSAFKYSEIFRIKNDSLYNAKIIQQTQLMTFEEDLLQQKLAQEKLKAEDQRKQNIQYALLGLGIIILLTFYLLLSRSFITNTKLIEFFGVVALLIVFEFLNLLLHPFLERITNHSPVVMLLALVCIAALLVPLHHKVEKWATSKLVEKNKAIRLASAKKTIEQLDKKPESL